MATGVPPGPGSTTVPPGEPSPPSHPLSWEGDRMFNIYIYDYCTKRGFNKTARELLSEAEIPQDSMPPINARQGLLFEWWSVFWVLFTAKSSGTGTEDAMIYTQHQAAQTAQRQAQRMQPQPPINRFMNTMQRPVGAPVPPNGQLPNGVGPNPGPPGQGSMPPGAPGGMTFPMSGTGPQPNGIPGPSNAPSAPGAPPAQGQNFQQLPPGQRPGGPQQRGPNGIPPFQSPTMAHSPQNPGGAQGQPHPQPPMGQLGPSPHLSHMPRGGMLPPGGPQGLGPGGPVQQTQTPTQTFQQIGRPPSRSGTGTPGKNMMMTNPSPSMTARQIPTALSSGSQLETNLNNELSRLGGPLLNNLKAEVGLGDKDIQSLTVDDKHRVVMQARRRGGVGQPGPSGAINATAGPSGSNPPMQPPNQRNLQQQQQQQQQGRTTKRHSTSPGEEHETLPRNDTSPPDRKRVRRSPLGMDQTQSLGGPMPYPPHLPQGGGPGGPQQMQNGIVRGQMGGPPMNGFHPAMNMNNPGLNMQVGGQGMGGQQMGNTMSPSMNHPGAGQMMNPSIQQQMQYRQTMHTLHKNGLPPGATIPNLSAGSPAGSDPSFNPNTPQGQGPQFPGGPGPNNRMSQNKSMGMMPPPSPASGPPKDQSGPNKDKQGNPSNGHPEGSPRNPPPNAGQGQGPPNASNAGQSGTNPATPVPVPNQNMTAPSPSAILGNPSSTMSQPGPSSTSASDMQTNLFSSDFIQSVASSLDEFDPSIFRPDGDLNFERDFGQWFNPDDVGGLDLK